MKKFLGLVMCCVAGCGPGDLPSYYGVDAGEWVLDGICQDPRFIGSGAVEAASQGRDASDCRELVNRGVVGIADVDAIFGDDNGDYAHDGECDDPYFEGRGMAVVLVGTDRGRDATDCRGLYESGNIRLR